MAYLGFGAKPCFSGYLLLLYNRQEGGNVGKQVEKISHLLPVSSVHGLGERTWYHFRHCPSFSLMNFLQQGKQGLGL